MYIEGRITFPEECRTHLKFLGNRRVTESKLYLYIYVYTHTHTHTHTHTEDPKYQKPPKRIYWS